MISTEKNIKIGIILSYITLVIGIVFSFFYTPIMLNVVGQSKYGLFSFVDSLTSWLCVISSALVSSYIRFSTMALKESEDKLKSVNSTYFIIFTILSIFSLIVGFSFVLLLRIFGPDLLKLDISNEDFNLFVLLIIFSILNISISIPGTLFGLYNNWKQKFVLVKLITLITTIIQPFFTLLLLYLKIGIVALSIAQLVTTFISIAINGLFAIKFYGFRIKKGFGFNKKMMLEITVFSTFIIFNSIVDQINTSVDKTILGFKSNTNAVAIYQIGMLFKNYLTVLSTSISSSFAPKVSSAVISNNKDRVSAIFYNVSKFQQIIVLMVLFGFLTCGYEFILLWVGDEYETSYLVGVVLLFLSSVPLTENTSIEIQRSMNKHKFRAVSYLIIAVFNVCISVLLVYLLPKDYSILACLIGTIVSSIFGHWILINIYNHKVIGLNVKKYYLSYLKYFVFGLISFGYASAAIRSFNTSSTITTFILKFAYFVLVYIGLVLLFDRKYIKFFFKKGSIEKL